MNQNSAQLQLDRLPSTMQQLNTETLIILQKHTTMVQL